MKKIVLMLLAALLYTPASYAMEMDRYIGVGGGDIAYANSSYSSGKSAHIKLGITEELGFGVEIEYSKTIDSLTTTTDNLDMTTSAAYLTYLVDINGEYRLKGRFGALDRTDKSTDVALGTDQYRTRLSYGLQLNYEPADEQVFYLDYTITPVSATVDLTVISAGVQFFF